MYLTIEEIQAKFPDSFIESDAHIESDAFIGRGTRIGRGAHIESNAFIGRGTRIGRGAHIESDAHIERGTRIGRGAFIESGAHIESNAFIGCDAHIESNAFIGCDAHIESNAFIGRGRKNVTSSIVISTQVSMGETGHLTGFMCDDGLIITCGCFNKYSGDTSDELRRAVVSKYDDDHFYLDAIALIEKWSRSQ